MSGEIITFPAAKRVPKAIVITQADDEWFVVVVLPASQTDGQHYGDIANPGRDFSTYEEAFRHAVHCFDTFGMEAGLHLIDHVRMEMGGAA